MSKIAKIVFNQPSKKQKEGYEFDLYYNVYYNINTLHNIMVHNSMSELLLFQDVSNILTPNKYEF